MKTRALILICCVVAVLSGIGLLTMYGQPGKGWLMTLFAVAVAAAVLILLSAIANLASRSMDSSYRSAIRDKDDRGPGSTPG